MLAMPRIEEESTYKSVYDSQFSRLELVLNKGRYTGKRLAGRTFAGGKLMRVRSSQYRVAAIPFHSDLRRILCLPLGAFDPQLSSVTASELALHLSPRLVTEGRTAWKCRYAVLDC